jgi:serine/threonine-protein kinase
MTRELERHPVTPSQDAEPVADLSGRTLGDFHILRRLGSGGMGQVYLAEQVSLRRRVALKVLKPDLANNPTALQRFRREAEAVARVSHPNIVQVYQIDCAAGVHFMALEYVEGRNLRDQVARKGPPDTMLALSIMRQVTSALQRAGELGIIHRDIKPENILLTRHGEAKVADFGLSLAQSAGQPAVNLTQPGVTMGTPLYMSPEQVEGRPLDPRTDIYSFGVSCYHMLAGQPPYRGQTALEVALQHVKGESEPLASLRPDLPAELCAIVHKMMARNPDERYQTCRELLTDLSKVHATVTNADGVAITLSGPQRPATITAEVPAARTRTTLVERRHRWLPWAVAGSILLAATSGAAVGWLRLHAAAKSSASATTAAEPEANPLRSEAEREDLMKRTVQQYLKPSGTTPQERATQVRMGIDHAVELTVFYLDRWRLSDADELFEKLTAAGDKVPQYLKLGKLGHALLLGLQDRPAESNKQFVEAVGNRDAFVQTLLRQNPRLQLWVARALDHNAENAPNEFPKELRPYQLPPTPPRRGPDKPQAGKGG